MNTPTPLPVRGALKRWVHLAETAEDIDPLHAEDAMDARDCIQRFLDLEGQFSADEWACLRAADARFEANADSVIERMKMAGAYLTCLPPDHYVYTFMKGHPYDEVPVPYSEHPLFDLPTALSRWIAASGDSHAAHWQDWQWAWGAMEAREDIVYHLQAGGSLTEKQAMLLAAADAAMDTRAAQVVSTLEVYGLLRTTDNDHYARHYARRVRPDPEPQEPYPAAWE